MDLSGSKIFLFAISWACSIAEILDVRLENGISGRVEIEVEGVGWNSICGSSWDMNDVIVTCRQLGFNGAQLETTFGSGTAPIYKRTFHCKGVESNLDDCRTLTSSQCIGNSAGAVCHGSSYLGCFSDVPQARLLSGTSYVDLTHMTIGDCISFCERRDYLYAGLELGSECYCGNDTDYSRYGRDGDGSCRHVCSGSSLETCGGIAKMAVHMTATPVVATTPPTTTMPTRRTPNPLEMTTFLSSNTMISSGTLTSRDVASTKDSEEIKATPPPDTTMMMVVYILGALLFFCVIVIIGCLIWNCKLRSRITYSVSKNHVASPVQNEGINALPYMTLSERRTDGGRDGGNGYQSLSVQRKEARRESMPDGPYASSLGEPVYQEPGVYMEPDAHTGAVSYKPGDPDEDELFLGGGNEYETLGTM